MQQSKVYSRRVLARLPASFFGRFKPLGLLWAF